MSTLRIRPATTAERSDTEVEWRRRVMLKKKRLPPKSLDAWGLIRALIPGDRIGVSFFNRAMVLAIETILADPSTQVLVAEFDSLPGEVLGWVVFGGGNLHFVRVLPGYGKRKIGASLVRCANKVAGVLLVPSYQTPDGRALAAAVERKAAP